MDPFEALLGTVQVITLVVLGFILRSYLPTYLAEKAKNLATKQDIEDITEKIEAVRSDYAKQQHVHEMAFDKEFDILSDVWARLVDLRNTTLRLRPILDTTDPTEEGEARKRSQNFWKSYIALVDTVEKNRPFYPTQIYQTLSEIMIISSEESAEFSYYQDAKRYPFNQKYWDRAVNNRARMLEAIDRVCEQIRERIAP